MKILIVRFSSIGDIVLTSPVVRALDEQLNDVEIHYLTKSSFRSIVDNNPRITNVFSIEKSVDEVIFELKKEQYDWVIDLHNNIRTKSLKSKLQKKSRTVRKLNWKKWLLVKLKINKMPNLHIVDRYFETVNQLGVSNDKLEGEFFISQENEVSVQKELGLQIGNYLSVAIGAQFGTKRMPVNKIVEVLNQVQMPLVLIGGETDIDTAKEIQKGVAKDVVNACGIYNLQQSASIVKQSQHLVTHDTGMMHIASCFNVPMTTLWGNTVPDLGMYAYLPSGKSNATIHQVDHLGCRPCSKIGFDKCPKGHFKCMNDQNIEQIVASIKN